MPNNTMVKAPLKHVREDAPLPFAIWDKNGTLLLARGKKPSREQIDSFARLKALSSADEIASWHMDFDQQVADLIRRSSGPQSPGSAPDANNSPMDRSADDSLLAREHADKQWISVADPLSSWDTIHLRTSILLHDAFETRMFLSKTESICTAFIRMMRHHPDASLYQLVCQSYHLKSNYSVTHALLTSAMAWLAADHLGFSNEDTALVVRSGITMNIAMTRLQNTLSTQVGAMDNWQKKAVLAHPHEGAKILRRCGVKDPRWLSVVEDHHERHDGSGYPAGKADAQIHAVTRVLHQADLFAARLAPRTSRPGLPSKLAARNAYLGPDGLPDAIGAALVKKIGIFAPGSFVRLVNGETAVVVRRAELAHAPRVAAITDRSGLARAKPLARETSDDAFAIESSVPCDSVNVIINHASMVRAIVFEEI